MTVQPAAGRPDIVDAATWQRHPDAVRAEEKAVTEALDALAAARRRLPMVRIDTPYTFDAPGGKVGLLD